MQWLCCALGLFCPLVFYDLFLALFCLLQAVALGTRLIAAAVTADGGGSTASDAQVGTDSLTFFCTGGHC